MASVFAEEGTPVDTMAIGDVVFFVAWKNTFPSYVLTVVSCLDVWA